MPLDITCQYCGKRFCVSDEVAGKHFRCVGCREILKAPLLPETDLPVWPKAGITTQRSPAADQRSRRESPSPPEQRGASGRPARRKVRPQRPAVPDDADFIDDDFAQDDPFSYDGPIEASWNDMPGGPVGQPKRKPKAKPRTRHTTQRNSNPEAFTAFDSIMNEVAVFWIGLAVIVGGFAILMSTVFWDGAGDQARYRTIIQWQSGIAVSMFAVGLITFSKSRIWLYCLFFICALYMLANVILAIVAGPLLWIPFVGFCLMYVRLGRALSVHP